MPPRLISFDEAGFTGPNLLDHDQPIFAYAGVDITQEEATEIVAKARAAHRIQSPELKARLLRQRPNWPLIALSIANATKGRAIVIAFDKLLNLGGKTFEYIFEPVLQEKSSLFYRLNLHRFVMNAMYDVLCSADRPAAVIAAELQRFMRTFRPEDAPSIFQRLNAHNESSVVLDSVLRFSRGYAATIEERTAHLRDDGNAKWTLDLTTTALFNLLFMGFGDRHDSLEVLCDDSKPLKAAAEFFDRLVGNLGTSVTDGARDVQLKGNLAGPLRLGSSADNPTLQIADVLAGATADTIRFHSDPAYAELVPWLDEHVHENYVLPNRTLSDTRRPGPRLCLDVLQELARRADHGEDALDGIEEFCRASFLRFRRR